MNELISVTVPTYERPDALDAVLRGLSRQTDRLFEVVIADDGSGPATAAVIAKWQDSSAHRFIMCVTNTTASAPPKSVTARFSPAPAATASSSTATAFRASISSRSTVHSPSPAGSSPAIASCCRPSSPPSCSRTTSNPSAGASALLVRWPRHVNRLMPALRLPLGPLRKAAPTRWEGARTCNLAVWRADLDKVDGFDASFAGWGLEDSDLAIRLIHAGVRRKDGRSATGVFHLWHPPYDRGGLADNKARLDEVIRSDRVRALRGLSTLDPVAAHG